VRQLVEGVTKKGRDWQDTRDLTVEKLRTVENLDVVRLKACDALHNAMSIDRDARYRGVDFWKNFNVGPADIVGYYQRMSDAIAGRIPDEPVSVELKMVVARFAEPRSKDALVDYLQRREEEDGPIPLEIKESVARLPRPE
jgi:hypothetical protein